MSFTAKPRVYVEIDHTILRSNFQRILNKVSPCSVLAVLKADAYGLGAYPIAQTLLKAGATRIGVAEPSEAFSLLDLGAPLQVMSAVLKEEVPDLIRAHISMPITDLEMATYIGNIATKLGIPAKGHIKIDSGMGRLGILIEDAKTIVPQCFNISGLEIEGIFTHFPMAYNIHGDFTEHQLHLFTELITTLSSQGYHFKYRHCANSDAINNYPPAATAPFNLVRAGLNIHGLFDTDGKRTMDIHPTFTVKTRLVSVRTLPKGRSIGYGATCRLFKPTTIGTISAGYADGLPLALSNRGTVLIRGKNAPILGRLSMDYTTVDLSLIPDATPGDEVTLIGTDGPESITPYDWALLKGTHPYDIICSLTQRVKRLHK